MPTLLGGNRTNPTPGNRGSGAPTSSPAAAALFNNTMDPRDVYMTAVQNLGMTPQQLRAQGQDSVAAYINANGWTGWSGGGTRAADYIALKDPTTGWNWGWDTLPAGDKTLQWTDDTEAITNPTRGKPGPGTAPTPTPPTGPTPPSGPTPPDGPAPPDEHGPLWKVTHRDQVPQPSATSQAPAMNMYSAAYQAALRARRRSSGTGRSGTVLSGFAGSSAPQTAPATLMGR